MCNLGAYLGRLSGCDLRPVQASTISGGGSVVKMHLKRTATDRLSLCKIWPAERWVLKELVHLQDPNTTCKVCGIIAARPEEQEKNRTASA